MRYVVPTFERRRTRARLAAAIVTTLLAACESPLSPPESAVLDDAEARWEDKGYEDYTFEMRLACFCPPEMNQWARVVVVAGQVIGVVILETGEAVPGDQREQWPTVEDVFDAIRGANDLDWLEDVEAEYDDALGFPTYASFESKPEIQDAGVAYYLRNAGPIIGFGRATPRQ